MDGFWKGAAGILMAVILVLAVEKQERPIALMLTMAVCVMTAITALSILEPVLELLAGLEAMAQLPSGGVDVLIKTAGIGMVTEILGMICQDSGNASLARMVQLLGTAVILYLAIPVVESLMELLQHILGGV